MRETVMLFDAVADRNRQLNSPRLVVHDFGADQHRERCLADDRFQYVPRQPTLAKLDLGRRHVTPPKSRGSLRCEPDALLDDRPPRQEYLERSVEVSTTCFGS